MTQKRFTKGTRNATVDNNVVFIEQQIIRCETEI